MPIVKKKVLLAGAFLTVSQIAMISPAYAEGDGRTIPTQAAVGSFTSSNPNLNEWELINLQATDVASALDGAGVKVAVLDGLVDCHNSALVGRCGYQGLPGGSYSGFNVHGTHVAGTIGGNPFGVAPGATILSYGVYADNGYVATGTALSDTWRNAHANGAQISSMSFACTRKALCFTSSDLATMASSSMPMLYVKAAGNDGAELLTEYTDASLSTATAALNRTLIVGSVNADGVISGYSNRPGSGCLIAQGTSSCSSELSWRNHFLVAPGESIYSAFPNEQFGYMSGTSMATPVVSGVAALLQARWPFLKASPETLAKILLTSATDLGDPGVDSVYGHGLINAAAAFVASGSVSIVSPTPPATDTSDGTTTTQPKLSKPQKGGGKSNPKRAAVGQGSFANLGSALGSITVFDQFGRDFRWDETGTLTVRGRPARHEQLLSRRLLGQVAQDAWTPKFFADKHFPASFVVYGSSADVPGVVPLVQPSVRAGVDVPVGRGALQIRMTGSTNPRSDFAFDPAMRPLAFFASTNLATGSLISNLLVPVGDKSRLMVYSIAATGSVAATSADTIYSDSPGRGLTYLRADKGHTEERQQNGLGLGWWKQAGANTVVGVNVSALDQTGGFYDATINLQGFDKRTRMINVGSAVSHAPGKWDLSAAGEISHLRMDAGDHAISFSPTTFVSAEVSVARSGLMLGGSGHDLSDMLRVAITMPPRAVSGNLQLDYMSRAADGLAVEAKRRRIAVGDLGHEPVKLEAAYRVRSAEIWSVEMSAGLDVEQVQERRAAEGLVSFRAAL